MSKSGFFCDQCLQIAGIDDFFDKTSFCEICLTSNEKIGNIYATLLEEGGVCEALMKVDEGETCVILGFFEEAYYEYENDDDNDDAPNSANHKEVVTKNFYGMRKTKTFLNRLDFNLNAWKLPVFDRLTQNLCLPLTILAKSSTITVTVAKVILLMIGSCLRDKTEALRLFDSVVYNRIKY
jgi:hypothetical protein